MTESAAALQSRARRTYARVERARRDPRFLRVVGRFQAARLLATNYDVPDRRRPITIEDALWAGEFEPRILELLPAAMIKKPSLFVTPRKLPEDLAETVRKLRQNETPAAFRGIPGPDVARWVRQVGHRGKTPSRLKCFRFNEEDQKLLQELAREHGLSETDTIRHALRAFARKRSS
jgi:hypothetical protein